MKIVFLATPDISLCAFEYFIKSNDYEVLALVTQCAKAQNRGKKIVERNITKMARDYSIPVFEPDKISKDKDIIEKLKALKPDFFITFAFGQILSQEVIDIPSFGTINLHASLLPEYRGANPIAQSIMDGKTKTGITTMETVLELDAGDICLQEEIEITPNMNVVELIQKISALSPALLDRTLKGIYKGTLQKVPQEHNKATFSKKLKKEDKLINWDDTARNIHNKIRGMYMINTPHTIFNNKIIKILKTQIIDLNGSTGEILKIEQDGIIVGTKNQSLKLITIKPEGKGEMNSADWARGARVQVGDKF